MTLTRCAQALALLFAAAVLPLGVAHAQEPDYEAVGDRLLEAVEEGELSPDQAEAMMGELARAHFKQRLEALRAEEGEDDEDEDEGDHWEGIAKRFEHLGMPRKRFDGMLEQLGKAGLVKRQFIPAVGAMLKLVYQLRENGGEISKKESKRVNHHFEEHDLNEKQIGMVWGMARRIAKHHGKGKKAPSREERGLAGHFKKMGVDIESLGKAKGALVEAGVRGNKLEQALGGMLRVIHGAKEKGEKFELDPRLREYFAKEVGLTDKQIDLVVGLARRLAYGAKKGAKEY